MRHIPGTKEIEGRRYIYLECRDADEFKLIFPKIATYGESPLPSSGGLINEDYALILPDGVRIHGISYRGDLVGWKRKVVECAANLGLKFGEVLGDCVRMQDGGAVSLADCQNEDNLSYR